MKCTQIISAGVLACILLSALSTADAACASDGIQLNSVCSQFTSAIKSNAAKINSAACSDLQTQLNDPQYGTPSADCCNYAKSFFGANCACDANTVLQAQLFYGFTQDSLNAAATAAAVRCGSSGCGTRCQSA